MQNAPSSARRGWGVGFHTPGGRWRLLHPTCSQLICTKRQYRRGSRRPSASRASSWVQIGCRIIGFGRAGAQSTSNGRQTQPNRYLVTGIGNWLFEPPGMPLQRNEHPEGSTTCNQSQYPITCFCSAVRLSTGRADTWRCCPVAEHGTSRCHLPTLRTQRPGQP